MTTQTKYGVKRRMPESHFIESDWLKHIEAGAFYYPASGEDLHEPIQVFSQHLAEMTFCDIEYNDLDAMPPIMSTSPDHVELTGPRLAEVQYSDRSKYVEPGKRIELYKSNRDHPLRIIRRRGFGQMGLAEFDSDSISVFMHRGDSSGEGGSNAFFLANRSKRYPPLANLFSKLKPRLSKKALIVSDGSNSDIGITKKYRSHAGRQLTPDQIYSEMRGEKYCSHGLSWQCVGWLSRRYGPTLVWGVQKLSVLLRD